MPFQRMTAFVLLAFVAMPCVSVQAMPPGKVDTSRWLLDSPSAIATTALPASGLFQPVANPDARSASDDLAVEAATATPGLRRLLADFSMTLRDIRYRRGGRDPAHGFDCSGFVRYVFQHSVGASLPANSAAQYLSGSKVDRADMKVGDLVFFRTRGKRISHVGIYLGDGRFIHSPSTGKHVSVSNLTEAYWAKRFAGAKRPEVLS